MAIVIIVVILLACLQIGRAFYYIGCFPLVNSIAKRAIKIRDEITSIFWECPAETILYVTALIIIIAVAIKNTYSI